MYVDSEVRAYTHRAAEFVAAKATTLEQTFTLARATIDGYAALKRRLDNQQLPMRDTSGRVVGPPRITAEKAAGQLRDASAQGRAIMEACRAQYETQLRDELAVVGTKLRKRRTAYGPDASDPSWRKAIDSASETRNPSDLLDRFIAAHRLFDDTTSSAALDVALDRGTPEVLEHWAQVWPADAADLRRYADLFHMIHSSQARLHRGLAFILPV